MYYLYKITNAIDNGIYIGITNNIQRRFAEHRLNSSNKKLKEAILKHGIDNFKFDVICIGSEVFIDELEKRYIQSIKADSNVIVYNISNGGLIGNGMPGEDHWNSRLTTEVVCHIREQYATGKFTLHDIGKAYGVGFQHISKIVRGEIWKNAPGPTNASNIGKSWTSRKVSNGQVPSIREEAKALHLAKQFKMLEFAKKYSMSRQNMRKLLEGITYSNLAGPIRQKDYT